MTIREASDGGLLLRVGIIGRGAIGGPIADALKSGTVPGVELVSVLRRDPQEPDEVPDLESLLSLGCDLVVEAAGHDALRSYGIAILEAGIDLAVLSAGALADRDLEDAFRVRRAGRVFLSTGAIGGLDILRALDLAGNLLRVKITSTASARVIASNLADQGRDDLLLATRKVVVAEGSAREVASRFPRNANVAATVGLATLGMDEVGAQLIADPSGLNKRHRIEADVVGGRVLIDMTSDPSSDNQNTSSVTPFAVIRMLSDATARFVIGV